VSLRLQGLLDEAAAGGVFPCARAVVRWRGRTVFGGGVGGPTVFDLASLTKPLATTAVFLSLWAEGKLEPDTPLGRAFPESPLGRTGATVADLLAHRSGLPAFVPFFARVLAEEPRLLDADCPPALRVAARRAVVEQALATPPVERRGAGARYSDVGFIVLGELVGVAAGVSLDALFAERVAAPLGLTAGFRRLSFPVVAAGPEVAPTGTRRPREPAPGQEGLWAALPEGLARPGEVDDDNAWAMDGVAGHAGLFGTADDVARFGQAVLDDLVGAGRIAPAALWEVALRRDAATPGSTRAFGFDTRLPGDAEGSSAGRFLGAAPPGAVGHLGFTGTSLWIDRARELVVALCTNRTALGRAETGIRDFRPRFHDAVVEELRS
jgi:CubicO group peptidase (beta-lactamase class C family)